MRTITGPMPKNSENKVLAVDSRKFKLGCCGLRPLVNVCATSLKARAMVQNRRVEPSRWNPSSPHIRQQSNALETRCHRLARMSPRRKPASKWQEVLVARLSDCNKHIALANEAGEILATLKDTLRLARDHVALELRK
jgi:hypothetical protein